MKNRKNIFAALAACAALVFASCSNLTDANVSSNSENRNPLNVEITNYDDILSDVSVQANTDSRTIIPDSFDSDGVDFYIFGTNVAGGTLSPKQVKFTPGANNKVGTVDIPADSNIWDFTLVAVEKGGSTPGTEAEAKTAAVLIGYDTVDMLNGDVAKFTLAPDGLTKEGKIAMKLYTDGWTIPDGYTAEAGLYLLTTGADATDTGDGKGTVTEVEPSPALTDSAPGTANFNVTSMAPGTYLFKVTFTNGNKNFYWSDIIVVLPGKTIENTIAIPNVIGVLPTVPSNFTAALVTGSEDKYYDSYVTEFAWERGSKNENYFEIDLLELDDGTTALPGAEEAWNTAAGLAGAVPTTYGMNFAASNIHESGSLIGGSTSVRAILKLGKRYAARIRAVNDAGASASYAYVGLTLTPGEGLEIFSTAVINRYRINYVLQGGSLDLDGNGAETAITSDVYSVYLFQEAATGNAIIEPNGDGSDPTPTLTKDTNKWGYWRTGTGTKCDTIWDANYPNYKGYKNLDLYAVFTSEGAVEIFDLKTLDIQPGWVECDKCAITNSSALITATGTEGEAAKWTFTATGIKDADGNAINDFTYDRVCFTVTSGSRFAYTTSIDNVKVDTAKDFTLPLEGLRGTYQVQFSAIKGKYTYSLTITLTVDR